MSTKIKRNFNSFIFLIDRFIISYAYRVGVEDFQICSITAVADNLKAILLCSKHHFIFELLIPKSFWTALSNEEIKLHKLIGPVSFP